MHSFKDSKERTWELAVNVESNERVTDAIGASPPAIFAAGPEEFGKFLGDSRFSKTLVALCGSAMRERGVTETDFKSSLDGDAVEAAVAALTEEIINFFPKSKRQSLRELMAKTEELGRMGTEVMLKKLTSIDASAVQRLCEDIIAQSTKKSGDSPASSDFIPVPSLSASSS